jgi:hypothetical protein
MTSWVLPTGFRAISNVDTKPNMTREVMKAKVVRPQFVVTPSTCNRTSGGNAHDDGVGGGAEVELGAGEDDDDGPHDEKNDEAEDVVEEEEEDEGIEDDDEEEEKEEEEEEESDEEEEAVDEEEEEPGSSVGWAGAEEGGADATLVTL